MSTPTNSKCGPIRKTLLTPCRRLGLSRKIKIQQDVPTSPHYQPLNIVKIGEENKLNHVIAKNTPIVIPNIKIKDSKSPSNLQSVTDQSFKSTKDKFTKNHKTQVSQNKENNEKSEHIKYVLKQSNAEYESKIEEIVMRKNISEPMHQLQETLKNTNSKSESTEQKSENVTRSISVEKKELKVKKSLKKLSMKRSSSTSDGVSDFEDYPNLIHENTSKPKRLRTDVEEIEMDIDAVSDIEFRIKVKKEKLQQLRRAETYKKLHNIDELQNLIDIWKKGCKKALNELFQKLQSHGTISMERLIEKFNIPEDVINDIDLSQ